VRGGALGAQFYRHHRLCLEHGCGDPGDLHKRVCPQFQEPTVMRMTLAFEIVSSKTRC
jgi:hypothetical protein